MAAKVTCSLKILLMIIIVHAVIFMSKKLESLDPQKGVKIVTSGLASIQDGRQTSRPIKIVKIAYDSPDCHLTAHKVSNF